MGIKGYVVTAAYIMCIVVANIFADNIVTVGISFAIGTLFFGAIFTLRDYIHSYFGKHVVYLVIGSAGIVTAVLAYINQIEYRVVIASLVALIISELTDTEIFHKLSDRYWYIRALSSNAVSIPLDTILFTLLAFYGIWETGLIMSVILGDVIIKFIIATILIGVKFVPQSSIFRQIPK